MLSQKYIVFNREEFNQAYNTIERHSFNSDVIPQEIDDAITFRVQDRFTATAMQSYFDAASNALEILLENGHAVDYTVIEDLSEIRDWAFEMAETARAEKHVKYPS